MATVERSAFEASLIGAIENDELIFCIVTSNTRGRFENKGVPYGAGKTTIAMQLAHKFSYYRQGYGFTNDRENAYTNPKSWDILFGDWTPENPTVRTKALWYYPHQVTDSMLAASDRGERLQVGVWDGVQFSAGAKHGTEGALVDLVGGLSEERPDLAIMFLTAPNILSIASVLRPLVQYELITFERGLYEVQRIKISKDFKNPTRDRVRLKPIEGIDREMAKSLGVDIDDYRVPPLPPEVKARYDAWRRFNKTIRLKALSERLKNRDLLLEPEEDDEEGSQAGLALARARWGKK